MFGLALVAAQGQPRGVAWTSALLALALAVPLLFVSKFLYVVAHEGGHAILGVVTLRNITEIRFAKDGSGMTAHTRGIWLFEILITAAGYLGPSMFGVLAAWMLERGRPDMVIWTSMVFLIAMLFSVRGFLGWLIVPVLLIVLFRIGTKAGPGTLAMCAYTWTWFLLISGLWHAAEHLFRGGYRDKDSDTGQLRRMTLLPGAFWAFILTLGAGAALIQGAALMT
jgi:Peptidase M50B-like